MPTPDGCQDGGQQEATILVEIHKLRQERMEAANDLKTLLGRLETNVKDFLERIALLEQHITNMEETEDRTVWLGRSITFRLHKHAKPCEEFTVKTQQHMDISCPGWLGKKMTFVTDFIHSSLQLRLPR